MSKTRDEGSFKKKKQTLGQTSASKGNNYLFLVAIDQYPKGSNLGLLRNAVNDAERLKNVLLKRYNFQDNNLQLKFLKNEEATILNITDHLKAICEGDREYDNLIFYFAGHGDTQGLCIYSTEQNEPKTIPYEGISPYLRKIDQQKNFNPPLDDYLLNKKFRHILFVFDCCYSGASFLGKGGNIYFEYFSRYALTSCAADQKAADEILGLPGGSPFSLALAEILENEGSDFYLDDIRIKLNNRIKLLTQSKQFVEYERLNFKMNGKGQFRFELKTEVQQKWKTEQIHHSILENLGFKEQRGNVESTYKPEKNNFNVFSACAETNNTHEILRKVIFRSASRVESLSKKGAALPLEKNPETLTIGDDIWGTFYRQMHNSVVESGPISELQKQEIVDWLIGRLLDESTLKPEPVHLGDSEKIVQKIVERMPKTIILQGQLSIIKDKIFDWCKEFYKIFIERSESYPVLLGGKPEDVNKIVIYFQEIKKDKTKITALIFDDEKIAEKANVVITPTAKKIGKIDIADWLKELPEALVNAKIEKLGREIEVQDFLPENKESTICEFEHSDFIKRVISFFELSLADEQKIFEELYNQKNESK